ncbi:uncharacterized protein LOC143299036 isoform X2 [Babylonia areolata]|uniref:uncharacterized protein LOC143299036 isoform X2 n=1 Tax=Babylonia areolata TaxID=304850 RepID=UPI003FD59371
MKPDKLSTATEESPSERVTASEQCGASISTENRADNPQRRSFSRPHLELLDPHVLLAGDGGKHKTESRDISPGAENSCDYKTRTTPGVGIPEISVGSQPHDAEKSTSLIAKQDENLCVEEPVMMRQSVNRPQKPARTSLVKEEITETNAAPLNSAIDRPLLPLKGTPRESSSSSSSSSDSEDGVNKKKSPADATERLQGVQTEKRDGAETERHEPQVRTEGLGEQQNDSSSADSSQFFTDTSQVDQVDKPDSSEIRVKNVEASERKPCFSAPNFAPSDTVVSPPASQKGSSDSDRNTGSFAKGKKDTRKPPVFVTPPPPPEKPVRTCGSQSDLSEKSDIEQDIVRSPPKPVRSMDRLSPSLSLAFDRDNQKGSPNTSVSSAPSSSESNQETRPPLVPPRREKPRMNGANHVELSSNLSDPDSVNTVMPRQAELKVDQLKPSSIAVQPLNKSYDHSGASAFVPYENSEIYYTDSASPQQHKDENSSPKTPLSSGSDQIKKENLQEKKIYRSDKSGSSSDESKRENDYSPPPVPPRQKTSSKKATVKNMPNMNSSTSSAVSQDSKGSRNQPSSADPMKPTVCLETATSITHNRPEIVFSSDFGTNKAPVATSLQVGASPEIHDRSDSSFELEVPMTESPSPRSFHSDVKLPLKPLRSPSPKVSRARTPSPKVAAPQPPSPETAARSTKSTFRPITSPSSVTESVQHTDEDNSEADTKTSMNRSVSMSSTTSATSHEDDKAKKGSKSRLRKYWPFRRKRGNKKDRKMEVQDADYEKSVSSPHLASLPLHHSTPTLERFASDPNTVGPSTSNNTDQHAESRPEDSDTSTLSESATKPNKEKKTKDKSSDKGKANLSASTSGSERDKDKKVKDKEKNKNNTANEGKEKADSSGNQSAGSSKNVTPTVERRSKGSKKAEEKESTRHSEDKQNVGKEHDTSTSSSSSARSSKDGKTGKDKEDTESKNFMDLPLTPPRVATPIREHSPAFYSVPHHTPQAEIQYNRFDGEFQRLDEDLQADADMATAVAEKRPPMVVVAVDLGTTHSGYAFSFSRDPSSVYVMSRWAGQEPGLLNHKTLSAVLLTPDHRFHSFGLAARNHYHNLLPIEARHWLYFERFKMTLHHSKELSRETLVTAVNGTQLPALTIFAHVLDFFVTHALQQLSDQSGTEFRRQDVRWVVTVPAIWREPAKQLMRQAALVAGMFTRADPSQLLIVLEPEAASIYCRRLRMHQLVPEGGGARPLQSPRRSMEIVNNTPAVSSLTVGTRYLVVDCGGGTVDITVHELSSSGQLVELHRATGGPHGSTGVDAEFEALLRSIFSSDFMDNYQRQYPVGWVNLMTDFESRKRAASPFKTTSFNVSLPFTFISEYRKHKGEVDQAVKKHGDPEVEWSLQGMLRLAPTAMKRLFTPTLISIRQAIGDVLNHPNTRDLRYLFLVGGFAESPLLQHEVRREFGHLLTVLIPQDVSLAVLRGAVLFGLDPKVVSVRCARLTYGVGILNRFDPDKHPDQKRVHRDGTDWCTDVFDRFVGINQPMALGTSITRRYTPARAGQLLIVLNIYSSVNPAPTFITDPGVSKCGTLYLDLRRSSSSSSTAVTTTTTTTTTTTSDADSDLKGGEGEGSQGCPPREILAKMAFGDTEISVTALDVRTGKEVKASVDFLSG